jgi:hypothetical protein
MEPNNGIPLPYCFDVLESPFDQIEVIGAGIEGK